jgi:hypothetical protein
MFPVAISARSDAAQFTMREIIVPDPGQEILFAAESETTISPTGSLRLS